MKRLSCLVLVGLVLLALVPTVTQAQVDASGRVSFDLRNNGTSVCSLDPRENTRICDFPAGVKEVEIVVSYQSLATDNALAVSLLDEWGNAIYFKGETVRESGSVLYKVTGTDVYNTYLRKLTDNIETYVTILGDRNAASTQQAASVLTTLEQSIIMVRQLQRYTNPTTPAQLADVVSHLETVQAKAQEVKPTGQTDEFRAQLIRDALAAAQQARQQFSASRSSLDGRTDLAFLNVDTANGRKMSGKLTRGGQVVESAEWAVSTTPIQRATAEPTREPTSTVGPTSTQAPAAVLTSQVATVLATLAAGPVATLPPVGVVNTPTPLPVEPTPTTAAVAPTATTQPVASATAAPTIGVTPGAAPATATALRLPPGAPQPALTGVVPTAQPTTASAAAKAVSAPAVALTATTAAGASAAAKAGPTNTAPAVALGPTEALPTASPTIARVAGKVSFNLTPAADGTTRVAGQASGGGLPITTIGLVLVAVVLGGAALWMRRRV